MTNSDSTSKTNSGGEQTPLAGIAPITVGNPADAASMAIDQRHMEEWINPEMQAGVVECRRPPKGLYFTVMAETGGEPWKNRGFYFLLEVEGRDPHLVVPAIADTKREEDTIRPVLIVRTVLMNGTEGLWALKLNPPEGRANRWNTSGLNVLHTGGGQVGSTHIGEGRVSVLDLAEIDRGGATEVHHAHVPGTHQCRVCGPCDSRARSPDLGRTRQR
jgi:hypothetical protein